MAGKGGAIPGNGRKRKDDEMRIRDLTSPYVGDAVAKVVHIMNFAEKHADQLAAAKLLLAYHYGQPSQSVDMTTLGDKITALNVNIMTDADSND
jgi:hypothetical protein